MQDAVQHAQCLLCLLHPLLAAGGSFLMNRFPCVDLPTKRASLRSCAQGAIQRIQSLLCLLLESVPHMLAACSGLLVSKSVGHLLSQLFDGGIHGQLAQACRSMAGC